MTARGICIAMPDPLACLYWVINIGLLLIASQLFARARFKLARSDFDGVEYNRRVQNVIYMLEKRAVFIFICVENSAIHQPARLNSLGAWCLERWPAKYFLFGAVLKTGEISFNVIYFSAQRDKSIDKD